MAPPAQSNEASFYLKANYDGDKHPYKVGDDINLYPGSLNDKFNSAVVGWDAKVLAWQHSGGSGAYAELTGDNPTLSFLGGLSRFKVVDNKTSIIAFKFTDTTGGIKKQYSLKLAAADVGEKILYSAEDDDFMLVNIS